MVIDIQENIKLLIVAICPQSYLIKEACISTIIRYEQCHFAFTSAIS